MRPAIDADRRLYAQIEDRYHQRVRVQRASLATEPAVWICCDAPDDAGPNDPRPLLGVDDARALRDALDRFITENADAGEHRRKRFVGDLQRQAA